MISRHPGDHGPGEYAYPATNRWSTVVALQPGELSFAVLSPHPIARGIRPIPVGAPHCGYPDHGGVAMPPVDPIQRADADAATQPSLLGPVMTGPTDGVSYADTSRHPADAQPPGEEKAEQQQRPPSRRRGVKRSTGPASDTAGEDLHRGGEPQSPATPPPPSGDMLTPDYQAAWLAHVARDALVVLMDPQAGDRDGEIEYRLCAVDQKTGRLDGGELMTEYRARASEAYLLSVGRHLSGPGQQAAFIACARHAREMRAARSARAIAANVGMSKLRFPALWADIPVCTPQDLDADLSVIGMPSGVWSIPARRFLSPEEARRALCSTAIRWDYDPTARHPEATDLFEYLYGDLKDVTMMEFARWRQAATALVRGPMQEVIVKVAETQSAKTTEGLLQQNAFYPLVVQGERGRHRGAKRIQHGGVQSQLVLGGFRTPSAAGQRARSYDEGPESAKDVGPSVAPRPLRGDLHHVPESGLAPASDRSI